MSNFDLDILAQQPRLNRLYTHLTLCFAIDDNKRNTITTALGNACKVLAESLPWVAGQVMHQDGLFQIQYKGGPIPFVVKETDTITTFEDLKSARFPFSMIHESVYAPCGTVATTDVYSAVLPVFLIQANYIKGGLLLTFAGQHGAMDISGLSQLMYLFSKACRSDSFNDSDLQFANAERWSGPSQAEEQSVPHIGKHEHTGRNPAPIDKDSRDSTNNSSDNSKIREANVKKQQESTVKRLKWAYFIFSKSALTALKGNASEQLMAGTFISTDDVLSAFVWLSITRIRAQRPSHQTSSSTTSLSRNVDMRRYLSVAESYPGLLVQDITYDSQIEVLLSQSLGIVAVQLRSALDSSLLVRQFHAQIERIETRDSQSMPRQTPAWEVRLSSWSKVGCYKLDFGFGRPAAVRRPAFLNGARDGLVYFLPKEPDDSIVVALCLGEMEIDMLKVDAEFSQFAGYIG